LLDVDEGMPEASPLASLNFETALGAHVTAVHFVAGRAAAALGDGRVCFLALDGSVAVLSVHAGAILCACGTADGTALLTGGDDGKVCRVTPAGGDIIEQQRKWIDAVAARKDGWAYSFGKTVALRTVAGAGRQISLPSAVGGIAATKTGFAIAHHGGVTLAAVVEDADAPLHLASDGAHVAITVSPNGRFIATATLDNGLCFWRTSDGFNVKMGGYPAKPLSLSWTKRGAWLATSGYRRLVMWPMTTAGGAAASADTLAPRNALVTAVACHPSIDLVAVGYADGAITFARQAVRKVLPLRAPDGEEITGVAFDKKGSMLAYGSAAGTVGLLDMRGIVS
jgi:WD40 repeat protein